MPSKLYDLIVLAQMRKSAEIDAVLHKRLGVLAKPQTFQPFANIMRHNCPILA